MDLKTLRKQRLFTQSELAEMLKVRQSTVSNWEQGITVPQKIQFEKLASILKVDVAVILACFYGEPKEIEI